ncbi:MAG: GtrA family protein [Pseudomonadota bacterium]
MTGRATLAALFVKYAAVGAVGTAGHYATLVLCVELLHMPPAPASALGAVVGAVTNYLLNRRFTYGSQLPHGATLPKFAATALLGVGLNAGLMALLAGALGLHYLLSQCVATVLIMAFTFLLNTAWTFKPRRP